MSGSQQRRTGGHGLSSETLSAFPYPLLGAYFYLFMNEYKTYKYIREKGYPQVAGGGQGLGGQNNVHLSSLPANYNGGMPKDQRDEFADLPLIQCRPQPVPVGHPDHPEFSGYDDDNEDDPYLRGQWW